MTEPSVIPPTMMPGKHGGLLRRGGGSPPVSKAKAETLEFLRSHTLDVAKALVVRALRGDTRAIELVLQYGIGKPVDKLEVTGADGGPVQFFEGFDDHERKALKAAIDAEILGRGTANGEPAGAAEGATVEGSGS